MLNSFLRTARGARAALAVVPLACAVFSGSGWAEPIATQASTIPDLVTSHAAVPAGAPPADQSMHIVVSLPLRNMEQLDALLPAIYDPQSPSYHNYLSVAEFTDRFGPSARDYDSAIAFFSQNGFKVGPRAANRYLIALDGKVSDVERVFHVTMGLYRHPTEGRNFMAPDRLPTLDLKTPIQQVIGLDDFVLPYRHLVRGESEERTTGSGPGGNFTGNDIREAYYPAGTLTGAGQSIGLMELEGVNLADVTAFFADGYGPKNSVAIHLISTDGAPVTCTGGCDDSEQALDIEYSISMAPGLSSMRVYVGNTAEDVLNAMASDNISKILSTSWGWNVNFKTDDGLFKEFAAQGQTNLTASGDYSTLTASGPWPEEDANIIAVGGTDLVTSSAGGPGRAKPAGAIVPAAPPPTRTSRSNPTSCPTSTRRMADPRRCGTCPMWRPVPIRTCIYARMVPAPADGAGPALPRPSGRASSRWRTNRPSPMVKRWSGSSTRRSMHWVRPAITARDSTTSPRARAGSSAVRSLMIW